jgi:hypothetical protein
MKLRAILSFFFLILFSPIFSDVLWGPTYDLSLEDIEVNSTSCAMNNQNQALCVWNAQLRDLL